MEGALQGVIEAAIPKAQHQHEQMMKLMQTQHEQTVKELKDWIAVTPHNRKKFPMVCHRSRQKGHFARDCSADMPCGSCKTSISSGVNSRRQR